ncbi:MAG: hypothetical protein JXL80_02480 [Planctomycetes bacterium]|nr:hypothetical protein [Planctomycetota bacterium]
MRDPLAIRLFQHVSIEKEDWFGDLMERLVKEHQLAPSSRKNLKLIGLLHHVHRLGARLIVIHDHYLCPDYLGDYSSLYSRMARPPRSHRAIRLLFFKSNKSQAEVLFHLEHGINGRVPADAASWKEYADSIGLIGFTVIRPTPDCLIGRTVLPSIPENGFITCTDTYLAHLYGTPLYVRGVPWLEQDASHFRCSGAALWACAYHTQTRWGLPHYSPGELTALARRFGVSGHVSRGLTGSEMATAIREWGFDPYSCIFNADDDDKQWLENLFAYAHMLLESNISVVLGYWQPGRRGHAVLAVGHGLSKKAVGAAKPDRLRSTTDWVDTFVVADDQRAPYTPIRLRNGDPTTDAADDFLSKAAAWAGKTDTVEIPSATKPLTECKRVTMVAPIPRGLRVLPEQVLPIARVALQYVPKMIVPGPGLSSTEAAKRRQPFLDIVHHPARYALRASLTQLKDFHWGLKTGQGWDSLVIDLQQAYLMMAWPTWLWVVQVVELHTNTSDEVDWSKSHAVGEVLIDATASPIGTRCAAFALRVKDTLVYCPDHNSSARKIVRLSKGNHSFPVVCP